MGASEALISHERQPAPRAPKCDVSVWPRVPLCHAKLIAHSPVSATHSALMRTPRWRATSAEMDDTDERRLHAARLASLQEAHVARSSCWLLERALLLFTQLNNKANNNKAALPFENYISLGCNEQTNGRKTSDPAPRSSGRGCERRLGVWLPIGVAGQPTLRARAERANKTTDGLPSWQAGAMDSGKIILASQRTPRSGFLIYLGAADRTPYFIMILRLVVT